MINLESRTFAKFYPQTSDNKTYLSRSHGIKTTGFRLMPNFFYDFGIVSPSAQDGQRRYELSFAKQAPKDETLPENYFRGLLGESLMRIVVMEFLRLQQKALGIKDFSMIKIDPRLPILRKSDNFFLEHQSRYNINLYYNDKPRGPIGEYDGVIEYVSSNKKGLLIMESKTGQEGIFSNPKHNEKGILDRYCNSLKELFPNYEIDLLFMGTPSIIMNPPYHKRRLQSNFSSLKDILFENDTGLIMLEFPINKKDFHQMSHRMASYHSLRSEDLPKTNTDNHYVENGRLMWFMKGKRITKILEKTDNQSWSEIYSI